MNIRTFPVLGTDQVVPFYLVYEHEKQAWKNHDQSVKRLKERGGLSWVELFAVINDMSINTDISIGAAETWVLQEVEKYNRNLITMSIKSNRLQLRPCVVMNGNNILRENIKNRGVLMNAYFHTWTEIMDSDKDKIYRLTLALVEYEDGSMDKIYPDNLRFID